MVLRSVNSIVVQAYFEQGKRIVEHEQSGKDYSNYGEYILDKLSKDLTVKLAKLIRKLYLTYKIAKSPFSQTWYLFYNYSQRYCFKVHF